MLPDVQEMYYDIYSEEEEREPDETQSGFVELLKHNDHATGWITVLII